MAEKQGHGGSWIGDVREKKYFWPMNVHTDQIYLDAIRQNDRPLLRRFIREAYPLLARWIRANNGTEDDAQDIFGDAMEVLCRKLQEGEIILTARLSTFVFGIGKNLWLKKLRRNKIDSGVRLNDPEVLSTTEQWHETIVTTERMKLFREKFHELADGCRRLLELSWNDEKISMERIATQMGFASAGYASKRKHECLEKLKALVRSDKRFEELK